MQGPEPSADRVLPLTSVPAFRGLGPAELQRLSRATRILDIATPREIFSQGDLSDAVYAITGGDGCVRIGAADRQSKLLMVEVFQTGDLFGEVGVIDGKPRTATAVSEGRVRLLRISAAGFREAMANSASLSETLCRTLARRLRRTFELLQDATFESLEVRLARQILYLADIAGRADKNDFRLVRRLRQGDLADLLGVTTRSIITILNAWRAKGIVAYDTRTAILTITNRPALEALLPRSHDEARSRSPQEHA